MCHGHEDLDETTKDYLRSINLPFLTWYWFEETGTVAIQRDRHSQGVQYNQVRHIYVCCNAWTWISVKWGTCYCQKKCISISWECLLARFHSELNAKKNSSWKSPASPVLFAILLGYVTRGYQLFHWEKQNDRWGRAEHLKPRSVCRISSRWESYINETVSKWSPLQEWSTWGKIQTAGSHQQKTWQLSNHCFRLVFGQLMICSHRTACIERNYLMFI